jgi:hypothetical protein
MKNKAVNASHRRQRERAAEMQKNALGMRSAACGMRTSACSMRERSLDAETGAGLLQYFSRKPFITWQLVLQPARLTGNVLYCSCFRSAVAGFLLIEIWSWIPTCAVPPIVYGEN